VPVRAVLRQMIGALAQHTPLCREPGRSRASGDVESRGRSWVRQPGRRCW
jgi:hypothetical protein